MCKQGREMKELSVSNELLNCDFFFLSPRTLMSFLGMYEFSQISVLIFSHKCKPIDTNAREPQDSGNIKQLC